MRIIARLTHKEPFRSSGPNSRPGRGGMPDVRKFIRVGFLNFEVCDLGVSILHIRDEDLRLQPRHSAASRLSGSRTAWVSLSFNIASFNYLTENAAST
jgi:hypothetical protein